MPDRSHTSKICEYINNLNMNPKQFLRMFLDSTEEEIVRRRQYWGTDTGWDSTEVILDLIKKRVNDSKPNDNNLERGIERWERYVLKQAQEIVNQQGMKRGCLPQGGFYSTQKINYNFLTAEAEGARATRMRESMPFLHDIIHSKISHAIQIRVERRQRAKVRKEEGMEEVVATKDHSHELDHGEDAEDDVRGLKSMEELMEGVSESVELTATEVERKQLKELPVTILSMISFASNRRINALQLQNSLAFVACGVSERVNDYLHFLGLTSTRETALRAMDSLGKATENMVKKKMAKSFKLQPSMVVDNLDIQCRIHHSRIESTTKMFHGSYGYLHFLPDHLTKDIDPADTTVESLVDCMKKSQEKPIDIKDLIPTQEHDNHWTLTRKADLARALIDYELKKDSDEYKYCHEHLQLSPPPVDKIDMYEPEIHMLKMISASDDSAGGVGELICQCKKQTGIDDIEFSKSLQLMEGDMGTCLNCESLIRKLFPAGHQEEALSNVLNLPGLSHTMWNMASNLASHHWGNPKDSMDTGLHQTAGSLGMKSDKPPSTQDFSSVLQLIHKSQAATMSFLLRQVIESQSTKVNLAEPGEAQSIIDQCFDRYMTVEALEKFEKKEDCTLHNMVLRLRDLATVTECDHAMRDGDIGRFLLMWRRWEIMAQGLKGLSHYGIHLPRYIMILERYLPPNLSKAIRHSLLIPTGGRSGHWVAKDFYLEIQNYWLKYFYNHSGEGTDVDRLMRRFSNIIPLLREQIHLLKVRSGLKDVYQNNPHPISKASLREFERMAQSHMSDPDISLHTRKLDVNDQVRDVETLGFAKFQSILKVEARKNLLSRFLWGSFNSRGTNLEQLDEFDRNELDV